MKSLKILILVSFLCFAGKLSAQINERALEIRNVYLTTTPVPAEYVDKGKKYPCFETRAEAISWFQAQTLFKDLEIVYVISSAPIVPGNEKELVIFPVE